MSSKAEESSKSRGPVSMKPFAESQKSQKTVKSMIETKGGDKGKEPSGKGKKGGKKEGELCVLTGALYSEAWGMTSQTVVLPRRLTMMGRTCFQ